MRVFALILVYLAMGFECRAEGIVGPAIAGTTGWLHQPRMALLIGNGSYGGQPKAGETKFNVLSNPCNDVMAIEAKLITLGWNPDDIVRKCDSDTASMMTSLRTFVQKFQYSDRPLGILYFAGHGLQVNDKNYLFGIDAAPNLNDAALLLARNPRATLFLKDSIDVNSFVYNSVGKITDGALLVVLDACRDNPLLDIILKKSITTSASAPRPIPSPPGIVTEFSTSNGATAADGIGGNSPFATALLNHLREATRVDDILAEVGTQVTEDSNEKQIPQRTGYFAQRNGSFWCFYGCSAALNPATVRFSRLQERSARFVSLDETQTFGSFFDGEPSGLTRLADGAESVTTKTSSEALDKSPGSKQSTQLIFARPVSSLPKSEAVTPLNVDVFYCLGDGAVERQTTSQNLANMVATIAVNQPVTSLTAISQVRLRAINPDPSLLPAQALNNQILLFDSNDPGSKAFSTAIMKASSSRLQLVSQREETPGYMSIFICSNAEVKKPPGQIFFQISNRDEEPIARRSIEGLRHALPDISISDSLALQPEKSPIGTEIHYYFEQDSEAAKVLSQALSSTLNVPVAFKLTKQDPPVSGTANAPQSGTFEVWLGKGLSKNNSRGDPKNNFWTTQDAVKDAGHIQSQIRQFKCGLPGLSC